MKHTIAALAFVFFVTMALQAQESSPVPSVTPNPNYWIAVDFEVSHVEQKFVAGMIKKSMQDSPALWEKQKTEKYYADDSKNVTTLPNGEKSWQFYSLYDPYQTVVVRNIPNLDNVADGTTIQIKVSREGVATDANGNRYPSYQCVGLYP
jgi:hypothetical protein